MKVSIVSLYGHFNYGNRLQSYAAQEILRDLGCDTTVIHVETRKTQVREIMKKVYFSPPVKALLRPSPSTVYKNRRQRNFERFTRENISEKAYYSVKAIEDADFFVLGSDQVWNPKRYNETKKQLFFLTFTEPRKKVCLSPSFGLSEIPEKWRAYFSEQLVTFPNLCAREDSGAAIIKQLTGRDVPVFIDPTLMLDRDKWSAAARKPEKVRTDGGYILQYFLGGVTGKAAEDAKDLSGRINVPVYDLMDPGSEGLYTSGPAEFLYLIEHASLIQTDSFHACVFSFLFGKPFLLYPREGKDADMLSRIDTLFNTFGLMRKYAAGGLDNDPFECDYTAGYERLEQEREKLKAFLKKSMNLI